MKANRIYIYFDGKPKPPKELNLSSKLTEIREKIKQSFSNNFLFLSGNDEVPNKEENDWLLKDIVISQNDKISLYLKSKVIQVITDDFAAPVHRPSVNVKAQINKLNKAEDENEKKSNVVIKGSIKLYTKKKEKGKNSDEDSDDDGKNNIEIDIYQYPTIEFSEKVKNKAITFLVIGET